MLSAKILSQCDTAMLRDIMLCLQQCVYCKRSVIVSGSNPADGMNFIKSGIIKVKELFTLNQPPVSLFLKSLCALTDSRGE